MSKNSNTYKSANNPSNLTEYLTPFKNALDPVTDNEIKEIVDASSSWLFDYLLRSGAGGFMLPLSGGADSAVVSL